MYTGIVKFFDSRDNKRFGFLRFDGQTNDIFFHFNDGCRIIPGEDELPVFLENSRVVRDPQKGDRVFFNLRFNNKGSKACPWGFLSEYEDAELVILKRPRYRVIHTFDSPPGTSGEPHIEWGGEKGRSLKDLCDRYPRDRHDSLAPFSDSDNIFDSHYDFQANYGNGWKKIEDPRPIVNGFVRRRPY